MDVFEELKTMMEDDSLHIAIASVKKLILAEDRSSLKVIVSVFPEEREIVARMTWDAVGPESGNFVFPSVDDLVLIAQVEGDDDQAFIIKRLTSRVDKIPVTAVDGSTVIKSLDGKKIWVTSDTRINLSKSDTQPTQNLILGQIFKSFAQSLLTEVKKLADENSKETHIGNLGFNTSVPNNATAYSAVKDAVQALKDSPIDDNAILSDIAFTEKGS